jgi:DivIVA domain-containing protein
VVAETIVADTVVPAITRRQMEGHKGGKVAWVVMVCTAALLGIWLIIGSVALYVGNRDLAAHGVRTQGQVVWTYVVYTVGGTDYEVPGAEVGDRPPGEAVTIVYDPRDPANSNLEDDWVAWHLHWILLGAGLFVLGAPAIPVVTGVFEADGPVGRRLARARPARRQLGTPTTPPGDRVVGAVSDAAGKALPAVAGKALREPFVPGSGDRLPAELRRVLAGYVAGACALFVGALACATALILFVFVADDLDQYNGLYDLLFGLVLMAFTWGAFVGAWTGAEKGVDVLQARGRFSRLLRQPSDPRTATVMASKRGGRILILDIPRDGVGRGYQSRTEVPLAWWMKAGMLMPGETVNVYGVSGVESPLLISNAERGGAFLGTVERQSAPDWPSDAASTAVSSPTTPTDAPPTTATWPLLEEPALPPAATGQSTDRPAEPLVSGTILTDGPSGPTQEDFQPPRWAEWAEWADSTRFSTPRRGSGYDTAEVDAFRQEIRDTFLGVRQHPLTSDEANDKRFRMARRRGYDVVQVDAFCDEAVQRLAAMRPA